MPELFALENWGGACVLECMRCVRACVLACSEDICCLCGYMHDFFMAFPCDDMRYLTKSSLKLMTTPLNVFPPLHPPIVAR